MSGSLFESSAPVPLAERLRPAKIADVAGQQHLLAPGAPLATMLNSGRLSSMVLWGPSGTGKTTLARLLAGATGMVFEQISAATSGIAELRKVVDIARERRQSGGKPTLLFLDEIHRWNKSTQDALLPHVENGTVTLVGATTENPSFEICGALLSRCMVYTLKKLETADLEKVLVRAEADAGYPVPVTASARPVLLSMADGDGRYLLNMAEILLKLPKSPPLDAEALAVHIQRRASLHDKASDAHHSLLSALQKSIRGSDVQAALYWLSRMLVAGEPARGILRRLAVMATEEVGLSDPGAIQHTIACSEAYERIGDPEGLPAVAQAVAYLATAPKSNAIYAGFYEAMDLARETGGAPVPLPLVNAPTALMRSLGMKEGYKFDHDFPDAFSGQEFLPSTLTGANRPKFYRPNERANEREILRRMAYWSALKAKLNTTE